MLTRSQRRALIILRDHGPMMPRDFAEHMWPTSDGWHRYAKCGPKGVHQGGGMYRAAGAYLGKLCRLGLVEHARNSRWNGYLISKEGRQALRQEGLL